MSDDSLQGCHAVVTGGSQGLGEAVARLFAARGAAGIVLSGRDVARGEAVAADLIAGGCRAYYVPGDLAEVANCRRLVATADERFGTLHVLVNAAAVTDRDSIWSAGPDEFDRMMAVNARAPLLLMQDAIRLMQRERVEGSIVNISSVVARCGPPFLMSYAMSKCALDVLTKNVANAVMHSRIRVNAIHVGSMDTPAEDAIQRRYHGAGDGWLQAAEASRPFGRLLKPDEIARTVAFLASGESGMMTGSLIDFDQTVPGANNAPPPPVADWPRITGVNFA